MENSVEAELDNELPAVKSLEETVDDDDLIFS